MQKIKNIELLRFLFALEIVALHSTYTILKPLAEDIALYSSIVENFKLAHISVDFFFIIAGFFLFLKTDFTQKFYDFAKKKLIRLMPLVFFSIFLFWICSKYTPITYLSYDNIFSLLNISNCGLTLRHGNNVCTWFVSALFWGMCLYFYLYKIIDKRIFNLVCACLIFFSFSFLLHTPSHTTNYDNLAYIFNKGMLRAIGGIGLGYFISEIFKENIDRLKNLKLNIIQKVSITLIEVYLFCFIFYNTLFHKLDYNNSLILIISFIGLFFFFIYQKGYFTQILENNFSLLCGKYAYSIFMTHWLILKLWRIYVTKQMHDWIILHPYLNLTYALILIILFGIITHYVIEKPAAKYLKKYL